jgi:hypothetical protein
VNISLIERKKNKLPILKAPEELSILYAIQSERIQLINTFFKVNLHLKILKILLSMNFRIVLSNGPNGKEKSTFNLGESVTGELKIRCPHEMYPHGELSEQKLIKIDFIMESLLKNGYLLAFLHTQD